MSQCVPRFPGFHLVWKSVLCVITFIFSNVTVVFSVNAEAHAATIFVHDGEKADPEPEVNGVESDVYCHPSDTSKPLKHLGTTNENGEFILERCECGSSLSAEPVKRTYQRSRPMQLPCEQADKIYIKVKETGFAFLLRNWRQSILFDEPAVAALSASEFASRVPPQLIGGESHDHLSRALESGRFDEAIAILAQILELQNTGGYGSQYLVSSNVLISQANAGSLAVIFAKRALDAYANVDIMFDEKQGRVVMTEKMKDALLQYQDLQGLRKTGHLDYPTLSRLSGTKASTLIYSDWSTSSRRPKVVFRLLDNLLRAIKTKQYGIISLIASELAHRVSGLGKRYSQDRFLAALKNQRFDQALMVTADYVTHYKHEMQMPPERRDLIFPTGVISRKTAESLVVISAKHALGAGDDAVMFDSKQQAAVMTESMQEVVRKYQRSKGLMSTGHLDYRTLEHLAGGIPISEMMYSDWSAQ